MVRFWMPIIIRHLIFRVPKRDHNFGNHPHTTITHMFRSLGLIGFRGYICICMCICIYIYTHIRFILIAEGTMGASIRECHREYQGLGFRVQGPQG